MPSVFYAIEPTLSHTIGKVPILGSVATYRIYLEYMLLLKSPIPSALCGLESETSSPFNRSSPRLGRLGPLEFGTLVRLMYAREATIVFLLFTETKS